MCSTLIFSFFFFNDTATTEIYTLSLHDALPICSTIPCFFVYFWSANCALPLQRVALSKAPSKPENGHVAGFVWFQPQREISAKSTSRAGLFVDPVAGRSNVNKPNATFGS